ncbi:hypothetical protein OBBRIDRAFT_838129 [Obba rivulosa]|uniref:Phosphatidylserine decarboxylase proenzyme 2 n=1 Tax=Obba rivulosa TaxID=1052685 RepID=A0A8E2DGY3_9APHY|nr:hypothetical protein OBBRIDRAFT_838129 [Obba rivulosa]
MVPAPKKALRFGRALKTAARLPARVSGGNGGGRNAFQPLPGETPVVMLRVQILGCKNLFAKDKNGHNDPFVVVQLLRNRYQTPVAKRTLNPDYHPRDATFDFPIHLSLADKLGGLELVIWDKDVLRKDYLGEVAIPLEDWFKNGNAFGFDDPANKPISVGVVSTRVNLQATGTVQLKLGFVNPPNTTSLMDYTEVYHELDKRSRPSLVSAPPTEGIGTVRSTSGGPAYEDDGLSTDEGELSETDEEDIPLSSSLNQLYIAPISPASEPVLASPQPRAAPVEIPSRPTPPSSQKTPVGHKPPSPSLAFNIPKIFPKRGANVRSLSMDATKMPVIPPSPSPGLLSSTPPQTPRPQTQQQKSKFRKSWTAKKTDYNLNAENDVMGIVMLEIQGATDLPRLKNMTRTGWDMDPFVVISFGKKVFRTRVIRHSLNPVWDEKLLFHVRRYETAFKVQLTVLDWDKLSSNDYVGEVSFSVAELLANAPQKDEKTGLYPDDFDGSHPMHQFKLPLWTAKEVAWESKHHPVLTFRAKYTPYDALRQQFWRQYLKQYDTDDSGRVSHVELTSMLDSLGSTLSRETISSFFTRFNKRPHEDTISVSQAVQCLETELCRPNSEKKRVDPEDAGLVSETSAPVTPAGIPVVPVGAGLSDPLGLNLDKLDFSGPPANAHEQHKDALAEQDPIAPAPYLTESMQQPLEHVAPPISGAVIVHSFSREISGSSSDADADSDPSPSSSAGSGSSGSRTGDSGDSTPAMSALEYASLERVINVKNCPLCHRPRLSAKGEVDIVTHLAVCASQDWAAVDRIMVSNFVTPNQAQRKWYTKVIAKVSAGNYKLGANSANIIVQNRLTGQLEEEKMQVYVRLGIRLLYKGWKSRMEGARARRLLKSMSLKQGVKYDSPASARDIAPFIDFHNLNVDEILEPISSFQTFNQFFYRKLKPGARPVECPDDPYRLVSGADCRLMAFETVTEATRLWIKGRDFGVSRLLGEAYRSEVDRYAGGALCIFRLAPQDYHRFHSPVDGTIGPMTFIQGEYYTVNPQAIRTALDVYGENVRKIVPIDSPQFGRVMMVCIGAMMVGSIKTTVQEGEQVRRGQEFGYFAFGGSTIVVLFEKGVVEWDEDLIINGRACLETLVRVGMGIGWSRRRASAGTSS